MVPDLLTNFMLEFVSFAKPRIVCLCLRVTAHIGFVAGRGVVQGMGTPL
jgi:hypothetical protein